MTLNIANLGVNANPDINLTTNINNYSGTSWTPPTSGLLVVDVHSAQTTGNPPIPIPQGNGLFFQQIQTVLFGSSGGQRLTRFGANLTGSITGITGFNFTGSSQLCCRASFYYVSGTGVDLTMGVTGAFVQSPTNSGTTGVTGSVAFAAALDSDNRPIFTSVHLANEGQVPKSNWTELDDFNGTAPATAISSQFRSDTFDRDAYNTWATSAAWGAIGSEIRATSASTTLVSGTDTPTLSITESSALTVGVSPSDTPTLSITEGTSAVTASVSPTDTPTLSITESSSTVVSVAPSDTLALSLTESTSIVVSVSPSDTLALSITEGTTGAVVSVNPSDSGSLSFTETSSLMVSVAPSDTLSISITESSTSTLSVNPSDTTSLSISETTSVAVSVNPSDILVISLTESSNVSVANAISVGDTASISITESSSVIIFNAISGTDTVGISVTESSSTFGSVSASDTASISFSESVSSSGQGNPSDSGSLSLGETASINGTASASDTLTLTLTEQSSLVITNFVTPIAGSDIFGLSFTESSSLVIVTPATYVVMRGQLLTRDGQLTEISASDERVFVLSAENSVLYNISISDSDS